MRVKLDAEAQALLGKEELIIITEEVDDVVLLIGHMEQMGLREILDHHIPKHWNQSELSWGWTAVIWLAYILSKGDHRKVAMEIYVKGMMNTLSNTTGQPIDPLYFSDDRLSRLLKHLGNKNYWKKIENELTEKTIEVFELPTEVVRCDATTVSGYHINEEGCLMQFGHSKDDPSLPQLKIMSGALDPLGMPLVTKVVSGETADDVLYIPVIEQIHDQLKKEGVLIVSDCKGSALSIRHCIVGQDNHYLSPLPLTGDTAISMEDWIKKGIEKDYAGELELCIRDNDKGESILLACGYEFERTIKIKIKNEDDEDNNNEDEWKERVLVIKSISHLQQQEKGLEKRLENAIGKIISLTPKRGKGIKQTTKEDDLIEAINKILRRYKVEGLLNVEYKLEVEKEEKYVGKGRGSAQRKKQVIKKIRYQVTTVTRDENKIEDAKDKLGWKAFVTNASKKQMSLSEAVLCYRREYRVERIFNRLKSELNIAPLYVKNDDQITGLTHLLMLGVRVLTLLEFIVRRSLEKDHEELENLHPENKKKTTNKPTAERLLKAFSRIHLTVIKTANNQIILKTLTALSVVQKKILSKLGLDENLYQKLESSISVEIESMHALKIII